MEKAHSDIYKRIVAEIEYELRTGKLDQAKLAKLIKELRDYESHLK